MVPGTFLLRGLRKNEPVPGGLCAPTKPGTGHEESFGQRAIKVDLPKSRRFSLNLGTTAAVLPSNGEGVTQRGRVFLGNVVLWKPERFSAYTGRKRRRHLAIGRHATGLNRTRRGRTFEREFGNIERRTVYYSGHVQGVGFRYETRSLANQFDVTGFVQNLDDGRVLWSWKDRRKKLISSLAGLRNR